MGRANKRIINEIPLVLITFVGKFTSGEYGVNQYFTVGRDSLHNRIGQNIALMGNLSISGNFEASKTR